MLGNFLSPCTSRRESESLSARRTVHKITTFEYPSLSPPYQPAGTLIDTSSQPQPCYVYQVTPGSQTSFASCRARRIGIMYQFPPRSAAPTRRPPERSAFSDTVKRFRDRADLQMEKSVSQSGSRGDYHVVRPSCAVTSWEISD